MYFNIYDVFYSQYSHQHVSAAIAVIFRVMLLLIGTKRGQDDLTSRQST